MISFKWVKFYVFSLDAIASVELDMSVIQSINFLFENTAIQTHVPFEARGGCRSGQERVLDYPDGKIMRALPGMLQPGQGRPGEATSSQGCPLIQPVACSVDG